MQTCLYTILAINFKGQISIIGFQISVQMMGRYSEELTSQFREMKTYVQCNIQGQKLAPGCKINKHIILFIHQSYRFTLDVYNDAALIFQ
jgi:hypothetical protein